MSDFSQRLEKEIQNTGKTLFYLAEASGLQLDYISKMSKGKRIPKEEERLIHLLNAMECTASTKASLLFLYRQEKMGKSQWQCMEELIHIIQQDVMDIPEISVFTSHTPHIESTLNNEFAIYSCIRENILNAGNSSVYLWTPELSTEHLRYLIQIIHESACYKLEHLFPLLQNQTSENTLNNLKKISVLKPAMLCEGYEPFYYYIPLSVTVEENFSLLPNWLITDTIAIGINFQTAQSIILRESNQIKLLKNEFLRKKEKAKKMLFRSDLESYVKDVNVMMNAGYVTHNYYIEYSPCLLHLIPANILEQQIILNNTEKKQLLSSLSQRTRHMETESMIHIFCISGLRQLMEEGRIAGYPDMLYKPLDPALRLWLLKTYYQYMLNTPHSCICVKENYIQLPKRISIVSSSNVNNGIAFWNNTSHGLQYYTIKEAGFSQKLYEFCQFLEKGNMAWSEQETLEIIRGMILEYGGTL